MTGNRVRRVVVAWAASVVLLAAVAGCSAAATTSSGTTSPSGSAVAPSSAPAAPSAERSSPASPAATRTGLAVAVLATIPVRPAGSIAGYDRTLFGQAWTDDNADPDGHNGCDTRNDILRRDLTEVRTTASSGGCKVASGVLHDPYTGTAVDFVEGPRTSDAVQIDHVVALGDAWQTGASSWSALTRVNFANDPLELLAVDEHNNESKGDADAASWLPPAGDCAYVARQIAVKHAYGLWVTATEHAALARVLTACPGQRLPVDGATPLEPGTAVAAPPATAAAVPTMTAAPTTAPATAVVHAGSFCAPAGATGVTSAGTPMVCGTTAKSPTRNRWHEPG